MAASRAVDGSPSTSTAALIEAAGEDVGGDALLGAGDQLAEMATVAAHDVAQHERRPGRLRCATEAGIQVLPVMVALGNWGLAHRQGEGRLQVRAELLRDGGPELVAAMIDELRELHLGVPRPDPDAPRASDQLRAAYETALRDKTSSEAAER
jgi:hypothetical protein